jgi:siroheme decarboxylase
MNHSVSLSDIDKKLLNILQNDFPLEREPFKEIANTLGMDESLVLSKVQELKDSGMLRRIGPVFDAKALGYSSALLAVKVPQDEETSAADFISSFKGVTHNYHRDDDFNIWFTLVATSTEELDKIIDRIKENIKPEKLIKLNAKKVFKIKGIFNV